jgi:D-alanyl-D-alanine carboxypeptidase
MVALHPSWGGCQPLKVVRQFHVRTKHGDTYFPGGVRIELAELITRLVQETDRRGYHFGVPGNPSYGCWGYNCRAIRGSSQLSFHAATAVDINAPKNPMGSRLITDMPDWMPNLWNAYGFRWGGDYVNRPDAMHYEFLGSVADAARLTKVARENRLGEDRVVVPPKPPEPPKPKGFRMYFFMISDSGDGKVWLTDMLTKRHMKDQDMLNQTYFILTANGAPVKELDRSKPWPAHTVDAIPVVG